MTIRTSSAVIVRATMITLNGEERTVNYGPFLPHCGSATTRFQTTIENELEESGRFSYWTTSIEAVYIGEQESDYADA